MPDRLAEAKQEHEATQQRMGECYGPSHCITCWLIAEAEKVERLEAKLEQQRQNSIIRPLYDDMRRAEGIKAAAKVIAELPTFSTWERELGSAAILASAKDNANA